MKLKGPNCTLITWKDVYDMAKLTAMKIKTSGFRPDAIVGITRGGWVHARIQCDMLGIKDLYAVKCEHWGVTARPDGKARLTVPINPDNIKDKHVLVVDDITDTGKSLILAVDHLKEVGVAKSVKTATLQFIKGSEFMPDFVSQIVDWSWFIYPWNYHEDLTNLVLKVFEGEKLDKLTTPQLQKHLREYNGIELSLPALTEIKQHMNFLGKIQDTQNDVWMKLDSTKGG